ncbi:MAG: hypothetical protein V4665_03325 [Patescibacteria group bacterium]
MNAKKIAIIGNDTVAKALTKGLIDFGGYKPTDIFVVCNDYFIEPSPESRNLETVRGNLKEYEDVILAVPSTEDVLSLLATLKSELSPSATIISFVSELSTTIMATILKWPYGRLIKATLNTNVAYGCGVVCYNGISSSAVFTMQRIFLQLAHPQGLIRIAGQDIAKATTAYGLMKTVDCRFIELLYEKEGGDISFPVFAKRISFADESVIQYLQAKKEAMVKIFGLMSFLNTDLSFESTLLAVQQDCHSMEDLQSQTRSTVRVVEPEVFTSFRSVGHMLVAKNLLKMFGKLHKTVKRSNHAIYGAFQKLREAYRQRPSQSKGSLSRSHVGW